MRRASKTDDNHAELRDLLREIPGVTVADTSGVGNGFPDFVCGYLGRNYMFEVKDPNKPKSRRKLTPAQKKFHANWTGDVRVIETLDDALDAMRIR